MRRPLVLVAAVARNGAIGRDGSIPWRLPGDLKHFRALTLGKPVILGRRTWASIGRPLPGRHLVVVTRDPALDLPGGVARAADPETALGLAEELAAAHGADEVVVAGGAALYKALAGRADRAEITEVALSPPADTFFPPLDPALWREIAREPRAPAEGDEAAYSVVTYSRR